MSLLDPPKTAPLSPVARSFPAIAGLLAAGAVIALVGSVLPPRTLSWTQLLGSAVQRIGTASLVCALFVSAFCAISSRISRTQSARLVIQTSQAAIWLAPLALFIRENSLWTITLAAVFAILAARALYALQECCAPTGARELVVLTLHPGHLAEALAFRPWTSTAAALCAQTGALTVLAGYTFAGTVLVAIAFGVWTWFFKATDASPAQPSSDSPNSQSLSLPALALAMLFMIAGLIPYLRVSRGFGRYGTASRTHRWYASPAGGPGQKPPDVVSSEDSTVASSGGDPGIILLPTKQAYTKLVAPSPVRLTRPSTAGESANPLVIPFNGVYWFFKAPDTQPPRSSRQAHASPEMVDIRSIDRRPLSIEAHEHLGTLINLDCCSRIQIAIRNADRYPETVSLELVLINTSLREKPSQSLGRIMVRSTPPWDLHKARPPLDETLNFAIPARSFLRRFDAVKIVFRLDRVRADAGARIAIDHLVLVPRGL
jgi:hypothetical protein